MRRIECLRLIKLLNTSMRRSKQNSGMAGKEKGIIRLFTNFGKKGPLKKEGEEYGTHLVKSQTPPSSRGERKRRPKGAIS